MTHFPNIHQRAEQLVRESRGRLNLREAYAELSRYGQAAKARNAGQATRGTSRQTQTHAWQLRADLL